MTLNDFFKKLRKIEFRMRNRSQETLAGTYHSAFKGRGMQFSECKEYEEGDDVRYIDWNASARQNGIFVKQFIEERELNVSIILDLSEPMRFGSIGMTKAEKAIEAMSIVAFSALQNNDKVGLFLFNEVGMKYIPQVHGKSNIVRLILEAMKFEPEPGEHCLEGVMAKLMMLMKRRSLVFVISDFLNPDYEQTLRHLAHRHDVIPIVVMDPMERFMPDMGLTFIQDLNTHEVKVADTASRAFRAYYSAQTELREKDQKDIFDRANVPFVRIMTNEDCLKPLIRAFERRAGHV